VVVNDNAPGAPGTYGGLDDFSGLNLPASDLFETVTVADYTFIVNKSLVLAQSGGTQNPRTHAHEFLLTTKEGSTNGYTNVVQLHIGTGYWRGATTNVPDSKSSMDSLLSRMLGDVDPVDEQGPITMDTGGGSPDLGLEEFADFRFTRISTNVLYGYQFQNTGTLHRIDAQDWYGDTLHELMATGLDGQDPSVLKFSDLPAEAPTDFVVEVAGDEGNTEDSFFVIYDDERRSWVETVKPSIDNALNAGTFPHVLIYNQLTGQFSFERGPWANRLVGDDVSAPAPAGIGKTVNDLFFHENRLCLLTGENVLMSEAGDYFNFFPTTVTTLIDSDPIDIAGTGNRVSVWDYAVPTRRQVLLFSSVGNVVASLVGSGDKNLSVDNARIVVQGTWAHSKLRPQELGQVVYFAHDKGGSSAVNELREIEVELWNSDEITAHVPGYIPRDLVDVSVGRAEQILLYRSDLTPNTLYAYGAETLGGKAVISSWSKWIFGEDDEIKFADWIESTLYLVIQRADGLHLEKIDFGKLDEDEGQGPAPLGHRVHLDSLVEVTGNYNGGTQETSWNLPYNPLANGGEYVIVRGSEWDEDSGLVIRQIPSASPYVLRADGDWTDHPVYIGRTYTSNYQMSQIVKRDADGFGEIGGRLQLRRGHVVHADTGAFDVEVSSDEDDNVSTVSFLPQRVGGSLVGRVIPSDGNFQFYIGGKNEDVRIRFTSDSFLPFKLSAVNWEGRYYRTAQ